MGKLEPLPDYGHLMTLKSFVAAVRCGMFIDYDGNGCYATETEMDGDAIVIPSEVKAGKINPNYAHVVWFNK